MLDKLIPFGVTPFFWTRLYNKTTAFVGHISEPCDEIFIDGDVMKNDFFAYFIKGNKIQAVAAQSRHVDALTFFMAFNKNKVPSASDVKSGKVTPKILRE